MIVITVAMVNTIATVTVNGGAGSGDDPRSGRLNTQYTNVATSKPITTWLSRSRMNQRITRGDSCELASCRLTMVSEKITPAVVMVAPAIVDSMVVATPLSILSRKRGAGPMLRSAMRVAIASSMPPSTISSGSANRLSRNR